jgi:hypothetical protein
MRIGIIAEGKADLAVIENILKGAIGLESENVQYLRPELFYDETDLSQMPPEAYSSWTWVKKECETGDKIASFFESPVDEPRFIVIHIDAAEAQDYGVTKPQKKKNQNYADDTRELIVQKINEWLQQRYSNRILYAVAIEETDAWVLTLYLTGDTTRFENVKDKLNRDLSKDKKLKNVLKQDTFVKYDELSRPLRKARTLNHSSKQNRSLELFCKNIQLVVTL